MVALIRRNGEPASCFAASVIETICCRVFSMFCLGVEGMSTTSSEIVVVVVAAFLRFLEGSWSLFLCLRFLSVRTVSVDMLNCSTSCRAVRSSLKIDSDSFEERKKSGRKNDRMRKKLDTRR